jgi:ribonuclease P protein component
VIARPRAITKDMRLRQRVDYVAVQNGGIKLHGRHVLAMARRRDQPEQAGRLGITVTKKVGNAVVRNHIKRRIREWMRINGWVPSGWDVVVVAKDSAAVQLHPEDFAPDLTKILRNLT